MRRFVSALVAFCIASITSLQLALVPAAAADVGLYCRNGFSSVTAPVANQTFVMNQADKTLYVWTGSVWKAITPPYFKLDATTAPGTSNDTTQGYIPGSYWFNTTTKKLYVCKDASAAAAVWDEVTNRIQASDVLSKFTTADLMSDFLASGLVGTDPGATRTMTTPSGVYYLNGLRVTSAGGAFTYTASKDTYDYAQADGTINHVAVNNGDPAPVGQTGLNTQKVVTDGTEITAVTQVAPNGPVINVANATTNSHAVNRGFGDGRWAPISITQPGTNNQVYVSTTSGSIFRALVDADMPIISIAKGGLGGTVTAPNMGLLVGTGTIYSVLTPPVAGLKHLRSKSDNSGLEWGDPPPGVGNTQANKINAGPVSGADAAASLRYAVQADYYNMPSLAGARMSAHATEAVPSADVTGATSIYVHPFKGGVVSFWDGTNWVPIKSTSIIALSLSGMPANTTHDLWVYNNAGAWATEQTTWKSVVASNSPTSGNNKAINVSDTTGVLVGELVTVADGSNNQVAEVTAISTNTSVTVRNLATGFTTPTVYYNARAAANEIVYQDSIPVRTGATGKRYWGTFRIGATAGQTNDSMASRLVDSYYHSMDRTLYAANTANTWTQITSAWRGAGNTLAIGTSRCEFVVGMPGKHIRASYQATVQTDGGGGADPAVGICYDNATTPESVASMTALSAYWHSPITSLTKQITLGYHHTTAVESASYFANNPSTVTWYGDNNTSIQFMRLEGLLLNWRPLVPLHWIPRRFDPSPDNVVALRKNSERWCA